MILHKAFLATKYGVAVRKSAKA